jgi:cell division topological specificity factor
MSIFNFFRSAPRQSAVQAKERLQIVMAHERAGRSGPDYLPLLQQELLSVIAKYVDIDQNKVEVKLDRGGDFSTLEVNIELPSRESGKAAVKPAGGDDNDAAKPAAGTKALTNGGLKKRG